MRLLPPSTQGRGPPPSQAGGYRNFQHSPHQRCVGRIWQKAIFILQYFGDEVFCCPQCAAVQHLLFPSSPSILVFLATLCLYLETIFFPEDDVFDCSFVTAVDPHTLQSHSSQVDISTVVNIKGAELFSYLYFLKHRGDCCLSLLFLLLTQVPMRELSSKRKIVALKMNFLKSLKVRTTRTSREVSVSLHPQKIQVRL